MKSNGVKNIYISKSIPKTRSFLPKKFLKTTAKNEREIKGRR